MKFLIFFIDTPSHNLLLIRYAASVVLTAALNPEAKSLKRAWTMNTVIVVKQQL